MVVLCNYFIDLAQSNSFLVYLSLTRACLCLIQLLSARSEQFILPVAKSMFLDPLLLYLFTEIRVKFENVFAKGLGILGSAFAVQIHIGLRCKALLVHLILLIKWEVVCSQMLLSVRFLIYGRLDFHHMG
jgi:hypothetical protein